MENIFFMLEICSCSYMYKSPFLCLLVTPKVPFQRRQWHPTPVLLPGKSHGRRSLVGCCPWGREESDTTERLHFHALEKEMATHSSVVTWRIPGTGEPGGLPSMGLHRDRHNWSDLAEARSLLIPWFSMCDKICQEIYTSSSWTYISSVQSLSCVRLFVIPWTAAHQSSLSITNSWSLLKLMSIELVMPSNHVILCCPLLLLPSIFSRIWVFSKESFFPWGGQNIGVSASASVLLKNTQNLFPL